MRSSVGLQYGWAAYIGNLGQDPQGGLAVAGDVLDVEISVEQGALDIADLNTPYACRVPAGPPVTTITARMSRVKMVRGRNDNEAFGDILGMWPEPDKGDGKPRRQYPVPMRAMAELARRHPEEFEEIRAAEAAMEPLRVVRHRWAGGNPERY
jgi:hypothetical protein